MFRVDHAALAVKNLNRSREFYEALGGRVVSKPSPNFLEIMLGELRLHLIPAGNPGTLPPAGIGIDHLCVQVGGLADLEIVRDRLNGSPLVASFGPFRIEESPPLGEDFVDHAEERPPLRTLYAKDPDGITLEFRAYN